MIKVLIVDDDKLARKGIISLLHWEKHQMVVVGRCAKWQRGVEIFE